MRAYLFLPKHGSPPYQTVIFFPAGTRFTCDRAATCPRLWVTSSSGSGRAFLYPVYKGTYERATSRTRCGPNDERELRIAWSRDLGRAIDYLETRPDVDRSRLAFYGVSDGADAGVILTALEPRLKTSVLQGAGLGDRGSAGNRSRNYAPRVRIPTLMLNGRYDFGAPVETAATSAVRPAGSPPDAETAHGLRDRSCVADRGRAPRDSALAGPLPWTGRRRPSLGGIRRGPTLVICRSVWQGSTRIAFRAGTRRSSWTVGYGG